MRVLVVVASRHGATGELALAMGEELRNRGLDPMSGSPQGPDNARRIGTSDAVILGSALYRQSWLAPAVDLAREHSGILRERPVWLFSSGPVGDPSLHEGPGELAELMELTGAREHRMFGGRLDSEDLDGQERDVVAELGAQDGDYRDWAAVRGWAGRIAAELAAATR
jgi:menaquinone-dependent protoporphyrinogen oxidase